MMVKLTKNFVQGPKINTATEMADVNLERIKSFQDEMSVIHQEMAIPFSTTFWKFPCQKLYHSLKHVQCM